MQQHRDNYTFLTQGPVYRVIGTMAVPTIVSMLVTSLYNVADTYFVGKINTQAVAAVGIVFSVMFVIQAFSFFFGNGSGNYIYGAQNEAYRMMEGRKVGKVVNLQRVMLSLMVEAPQNETFTLV